MEDPPHMRIGRALARHRRYLLILPALFVLWFPASGLAKSSSATAISGKLAYTKYSFSHELFALTPYQWTVTPLTTSSALSRHPVLSPDSSQLAFMSTRGDGRWNIYLAASAHEC